MSDTKDWVAIVRDARIAALEQTVKEAARAVVELATRIQMIETQRWGEVVEGSIHYQDAAALKARYEEEGS